MSFDMPYEDDRPPCCDQCNERLPPGAGVEVDGLLCCPDCAHELPWTPLQVAGMREVDRMLEEGVGR